MPGRHTKWSHPVSRHLPSWVQTVQKSSNSVIVHLVRSVRSQVSCTGSWIRHKALAILVSLGLVFFLQMLHQGMGRLQIFHEGHRASTKPTTRQTASQYAGKSLGQLHENVDFLAAHLVVISHAGVRLIHSLAQSLPIALLQIPSRLERPSVLRYDVMCPSKGDGIHLFLGFQDLVQRGIAQGHVRIVTKQGLGGRFALGHTDGVFSCSNGMFDIGIGNHQDNRMGFLHLFGRIGKGCAIN
mmetsp:Transcript_5536/g.12275  ORF Transcript_5536/g.12275 Transcript_5536/m.12275 type:complete len:241 (-) Transcript_5536:753-1475(-)